MTDYCHKGRCQASCSGLASTSRPAFSRTGHTAISALNHRTDVRQGERTPGGASGIPRQSPVSVSRRRGARSMNTAISSAPMPAANPAERSSDREDSIAPRFAAFPFTPAL